MTPHERSKLFWKQLRDREIPISDDESVSHLTTEFQAQSNEDLERHREKREMIQMKLDAALFREDRLIVMLRRHRESSYSRQLLIEAEIGILLADYPRSLDKLQPEKPVGKSSGNLLGVQRMEIERLNRKIKRLQDRLSEVYELAREDNEE